MRAVQGWSARTLAAVLALAAAPVAAQETGPRATAAFIDRSGNPAGTATLTEGPHGVLIRAEVEGLTPGWHAIHIHTVGTCADPAAGFQAAGGHLDPTGAQHGLMNPEGPEAGDLPNIHAGSDGTARSEHFATLLSLTGTGEGGGILDADGAALIVHANPDDHMTQPIGGSGDRVACAVIERAE